MMVQASDELGFEADNIPLIIEAVPVSNECIMLIVTKVEVRRSWIHVFPSSHLLPRYWSLSDTDDEIYSSADDILDIFKRLGSDILSKTAELHSISGTADLPSDTETTSGDASSEDEEPQKTILRIYEFRTLNEVSCLSEQFPADFECGNTLYKNPNNGHYYLVLSSEGVSRTVFGSICRLASEFGSIQKASANTLYYFDEHYETIIRENALQILQKLIRSVCLDQIMNFICINLTKKVTILL